MKSGQRALRHGRQQQPYDHEGTTSSLQENYGAGGEYRGEVDFGGFSDQDYGSQGYGGQGYGDRSYGDPDYGGQTFSRRTGSDRDFADTDLGATAYERHGEFAAGPYRDDAGPQHSGAVGYGDARGLGPKGYARSDARVLEHVCDQLTDDDLLDAGDIEVQVGDGVVTLSGTVGSREARWHAEQIAADARGVVDVVNRLQVVRPGAPREA